LNVVCGGHYATEVWGVRRVMSELARETGLETEFLDAPTAPLGSARRLHEQHA
jgi:putative NIF3 family GTP cyclohydrolase 1 type 2